MALNSLFLSGRRRLMLVIVLVLLIGGAAFFFIYVKNHPSNTSQNQPNTTFNPHSKTAGQNTKGEAPTPLLPNPSAKGEGPETGGNGTSNATLVTPTGNFVNNHHPTQSAPGNQMYSSCVTSIGATCQINFTNTTTGQVVSLTAQAVDSSGSAYWSWTLQQVGITQGSWKITATATLNGQSKSASDAMNLEVQS